MTHYQTFKKERIFFESSAAAKVRKIKSLRLDFYVDDLLSILNHRQFPVVTKKILFNSSKLKLNNIYFASNGLKKNSVFRRNQINQNILKGGAAIQLSNYE